MLRNHLNTFSCPFNMLLPSRVWVESAFASPSMCVHSRGSNTCFEKALRRILSGNRHEVRLLCALLSFRLPPFGSSLITPHLPLVSAICPANASSLIPGRSLRTVQFSFVVQACLNCYCPRPFDFDVVGRTGSRNTYLRFLAMLVCSRPHRFSSHHHHARTPTPSL